MRDLSAPLSTLEGFVLALALGLLIGRTREPAPGDPPRPGIRDFLIVAAGGATCGYLHSLALTVPVFIAVAAMLAIMRIERPERAGITTELAALLTFLVGYMELASSRELASALGLTLAAIVATRNRLRSFARDVISDREYLDTLAFLSLIFIVLPLLPAGAYGPFHFFDPRQIWTFIILVSGVGYAGYFLTKFFGEQSGALLTAMVGGFASSTAYTVEASRVVEESPSSAVPMARACLIANTILFPRLVILAAAISPDLALASLPSMAVMTAVGFVAAFLFARASRHSHHQRLADRQTNPFALIPALKFGAAFTVVLFITKAGKHLFGGSGELVSAAIGGLIDANAVTVGFAQFYAAGSSSLGAGVLAMAVAAASNALFKEGIAITSRRKAYWLRLGAGFVAMFAVGAAFLLAVGVPPVHIPG